MKNNKRFVILFLFLIVVCVLLFWWNLLDSGQSAPSAAGTEYYMEAMGTLGSPEYQSAAVTLGDTVITQSESHVLGLEICDEETTNTRLQGKDYVEASPELIENVLLDNAKASYCSNANLILITQSLVQNTFIGTITSADENISLWVKTDSYWLQKADAIRENHEFSLVIAGESSYTTVSLLFTGLDTISIRTDKVVSTEYGIASVSIWAEADEEDGRIDLWDFSGSIKESTSAETCTLKTEPMSLLGMNTAKSWKLYKICSFSDGQFLTEDNSCTRMRLAMDMWNQINETDELDRPYQLAELILDEQYAGLVLLTPTQSANYFRVKKNALSKYDSDNSQTADFSHAANAVSYALFLQMTYAYENLSESYGELSIGNQYYLFPDRIEYSFGTLPSRIRWRTWQWDRHILDSEDYCTDLESSLCEAYKAYRNAGGSAEALCSQIDLYSAELENTGAALRSAFDSSEIEELKNDITSRFYNLDHYYGYENAESEAPVLSDQTSDSPFLDIALTGNSEGTEWNTKLYTDGDTCYAFLPAFASGTLKIVYDEQLYSVSLNGDRLDSGEELQPAEYKTAKAYTLEVTETDSGTGTSSKSSYTFYLLQSENIASVFIETITGSTEFMAESKSNKEPVTLTCINADGATALPAQEASMHARGSMSFGYPKKSYTISFNEAVDVMGMGEAENWVLQANYWDASLLKNRMAYKLADLVGVPNAVSCEYADVYFNGEYAGNYLICEPVEVSSYHIDLDDTTGQSYFFAVDTSSEEGRTVSDSYGTVYDIRYPENASEEDAEYVSSVIENIESCLSHQDSENAYETYETVSQIIDIDSFAAMYLMDQWTDDYDSNYRSTFYYINGNNGKLYAGPAWDYDLAWGNGWEDMSYNAFSDGLPEYLSENLYFLEDVQNWISNHTAQLESYMDSAYDDAARIASSSYMNRLRWAKDTEADALEYLSVDYVAANIRTRIELLTSVILHPEDYVKVSISSEAKTRTVWVKKGENLTTATVKGLCSFFGTDRLILENGEFWSESLTIEEPIVLYPQSENEP